MATVIVVAALLALGVGRDAHAATLTVVNTNDSGAGSLRRAIADAAPGDTIDFNAGLTGQTITLTTGELVVSKNLTVNGPVAGITVSGNNASRVFEISGGVTANMSGLTLAGGNGANSGGGILNDGILTLTNSTISGNTANNEGGGIFNGGTLTVSNSAVSGNSTRSRAGGIGGGIYNLGTLTISNSTVSGNSTSYIGGGIYNLGTLTVSNSTVSGNATKGGGGIYNDGGLILSNSTISGNSASYIGGGIFNEGTLTLSNNTISCNSAYYGGGIYNEWPGTLTLMNSTVSGNSANFGGGISSGGTLTLMNSTVSGNSAGGNCSTTVLNSSGTITSLGYNLDSDGTCNLTAAGDLPNTNPMLDPLALNPPGTTQTQALQPGSPAIDHIPFGTNGCGTTVSTDQRGVSRPQGYGCEIGAYEVPGARPVGGLVDILRSNPSSPSTLLPITLGSAVLCALAASGWYVRRRLHR